MATLLAALTLALVGYSDDDPEPKFLPTESSSPSEPSSSPTTEPTDVRDPEQTVLAWVDARNVTVQSGDTTAVDALTAPTCETCRNSVDAVVRIYDQGGHYETSGWEVVKSRVVNESEQSAKLSVDLLYDAGRTYPSAGADPIAYREERHTAIFRLSHETSGWLVEFIGYLS